MRRILLRYHTGAKAGQIEVYPISRYASLALGRDAACDVRFHPTRDVIVSRNHAMIEWSEDDPPMFRISDLLSSNGTFLNGRRIGRSVLLRGGDRIQLGSGGPIIEFSFDEVAQDESRPSTGLSAPVNTQEIPAVLVTRTRERRAS
jgi:pSer/pThr/pTyr-binding forkhead associated (FHA) protein